MLREIEVTIMMAGPIWSCWLIWGKTFLQAWRHHVSNDAIIVSFLCLLAVMGWGGVLLRIHHVGSWTVGLLLHPPFVFVWPTKWVKISSSKPWFLPFYEPQTCLIVYLGKWQLRLYYMPYVKS